MKGPKAGGGTEQNQRQLRVGEQIRHVLADLLLRGEVHDPVLSATTLTITEVKVTRDLRQATAYVTELGSDLRTDTLKALKRATPYLRGEAAKRLHLKYAPSLTFRADETFAEVARIDALIAGAKAEQPSKDDDDHG